METERQTTVDDARVLRYEVATRDTLDRVAHAPLPGIAGEGPTARDLFRDVFFDTADAALESRGAVARIRFAADGGRVFEVAVRGDTPETARHATVFTTQGEPAELFAGLSEPARLLRALVDPALLAPVLALETDRLLRDGDGGVRVACDAVTLRVGETTAPLHEVEVALPAGGDEVTHAELLQ